MTDGRPSEPTAEIAPIEGPGSGPTPPSVSRPLGGGTFSLEGRPAPGLYLFSWLLAGAGVAVAFVGSLTQPPVAALLAGAGLLLIGVGLAAAAGYQVLARASRPAVAYRGPSPAIVFGILFVFVNVLGLGVLAVGLGDPGTTGGFVLAGGLLFAGYLLIIWLFVVRTGALSWAEMGLPAGRGAARIAGDIGLGAAVMVPVMFAVLIGGGVLAQLVDVRPPVVVPIPEAPIDLVAVAVAAAVAIPIGEELFFRGFALTAWLRDLGARSALIRSAIFFTLVHVANITATTFEEGAKQALVQSAVILPLGLVLGWLFLQRGLWAAIAGHITYNGTLLVLQAALRDVLPTAG